MSTSAIIVVKTPSSYKAIYVGGDGYPSHLYKVLRDHYSTQEAAESIVNLGDASFIDKTLENSVFYGRDRGEMSTECVEFDILTHVKDDFDGDFNYLWTGDRWVMLPEFDEDLIPKVLTMSAKAIEDFQQLIDISENFLADHDFHALVLEEAKASLKWLKEQK